MSEIRIHTRRTDEFSIGDILRDESTRKIYKVKVIKDYFVDAEEIEKQPRRGPAPPQKYYQKFNKGWNR